MRRMHPPRAPASPCEAARAFGSRMKVLNGNGMVYTRRYSIALLSAVPFNLSAKSRELSPSQNRIRSERSTEPVRSHN